MNRYRPPVGVMLASTMIVLFALARPLASNADETLDGLEVGFTEAGHPYKGASDAPLILVEYSDYLCPYCARHFRTTLPALMDGYVADGLMKLEFRHFPIPALHPTAIAGHRAASCAGEQGAVAFWRYHRALFGRQQAWNTLADPTAFLSDLAAEQGLDVARHAICLVEERSLAVVESAMAEAGELGLSGTPGFLIRRSEEKEGHTLVGALPLERFADYADALIEGSEPPKPPEPPKRELPPWARAEALASDADRPGFTRSGNPESGAADAPLVIVEYTDFQCPACARQTLEELPRVFERLVDTGKVRWVVKHLPLREHANAVAAAVAARCAGDQGHYWDMHHLLFERQGDWASSEPPDPALLRLAATLELDASSFERCLQSREALERVLPDLHDAATVTRSTPTFVILDGESGRTLRGRRDAEAFIASVEKLLDARTETTSTSVRR